MINLCSKDDREPSDPATLDWHWQVRHSVTAAQRLEAHLDLKPDDLAAISEAARTYPFRITPYYLSLAAEPSLADPILRQCLPVPDELLAFQGEAVDPFNEGAHMPVPGLIRRYQDRAVLLINNPCAVLCRHCFRKRLWAKVTQTHLRPASQDSGLPAEICPIPSPRASEAGPGGGFSPGVSLHNIVNYLRQNPEIREIIVSGGDPLMLEDERLKQIFVELQGVDSLELIRLATRLPATLPQRITKALCGILAGVAADKPIWVVAHFNHPLELTSASAEACRRLINAGLPVVSQTVLLKGVNDHVHTLRTLFTGLLSLRVKPYYLFHGDAAAGTMHFRVAEECGRELMRELRDTTSGLAIPTYAADIPGAPSKTPLA